MCKFEYHFETGNLDPYEYEVDKHDVRKALKALDRHCLDNVEDDEIHEVIEEYRDALTEYFEEDAREEYKDAKQLSVNPDAYYGVNRRD